MNGRALIPTPVVSSADDAKAQLAKAIRNRKRLLRQRRATIIEHALPGGLADRHVKFATSVDAALEETEQRISQLRHIAEALGEQETAWRYIAALRKKDDKARRARYWADNALDWFSAFVPARIANEEIGDAIEHIDAHLKAGCSSLWIRINVVMTILWIFAHAVAEVFKGKSTKQRR